MKSWNENVRKEIYRIQREAQPKKETRMGSSLFPIIREQTVLRFYNHRMAEAALFGQKIVIDLSFESTMNHIELSSLYKQLQFSYNANKVRVEATE